MARTRFFHKWLGLLHTSSHRPTPRRPRLGARLCRLEPLEERTVLSVISPTADLSAEVAALSAPAQTNAATDPAIIGQLTRDAMGENGDGPMAKMGWDLTYSYFEYQAFVENGGDPAEFTPTHTSVSVVNGRVLVEFTTTEPINWEVVQQLQAARLELTGYSGISGSAWLPLSAVDDVAALDVVTSVHPAHAMTVGHDPGVAPSEVTVDWDAAHRAYGRMGDGPMGKVGWDLTKVYYEYKATVDAGFSDADYVPSARSLRVIDGRILVEFTTTEPMTTETVDESRHAQTTANWKMLEELRGVGLEVTGYSGISGNAWLPLSAIADVATLEAVSVVHPAYAFTSVGTTTSLGDAAMHTDDLRSNLGIDGADVTVGVISDSYDQNESAATDASDDVQSGDLPSVVQVLDDSYTPGKDEGRAMLQVLHDVAPNAELMFHTWGDAETDRAAAARELADAGADIIVDDLFALGEPMFTDGKFAQAIDDVTDNGVVYFCSAGNQADRSYESAFDSGTYYQDGYFQSDQVGT